MSEISSKMTEALARRDELGIHCIFPQPLLDQLSSLANISYADRIFVPSSPSFKPSDVLDPIHASLEDLWVSKYDLGACFEIFQRYRGFEPMLFRETRYRDHLTHQYLVFLTGLPIIDKLRLDLERGMSNFDGVITDLVDIEKTWLLASTYHDVSYPIQQLESWLSSFFLEFLAVGTNPVRVDMSSMLLERGFLASWSKLYELSYQLFRKINPVIDKDSLGKMWMEALLERNHGVFSSLILLDKYDIHSTPGSGQYSMELFSSQLLPAALAIALHDEFVWQNSVIPALSFEHDPITFILVYCDAVQEWGRPAAPFRTYKSPYLPVMTEFNLSDSGVSVTLEYDVIKEANSNGKTSTSFERKANQLSRVFSKLRSPTTKFEITLEPTDSDFDYERTCYVVPE